MEVDVTSPSLDKLSIYARLGIREVWRFASERAEILAPDGTAQGYEAVPGSRVLPFVVAGDIQRLVEMGLTSRRPAWVREVRARARNRGKAGG